MTDEDFLDGMRARINPAYADQRGTESWERKLALAIIDRLAGEVAMLRTGDTCARMCEGTAYRLEMQRLRRRIEWSPEHPELDGIYRRDETIRLQDAEIEKLRAECEVMRSDMSELKPDPRCDISCMLICNGEAKYLRDAVDSILASTGTYYMDQPDGGDVSVIEQLARMAKDAARYRFLCECDTGNLNYWLHKTQGDIGEDLTAGIDAAISEQALQAMSDEAQADGEYK